MSKYDFTEEEIKKILLFSPMVLPNNPIEQGLKGDALKTYFYGFIRELMLLLSEKLLQLGSDGGLQINLHNENEEAHSDMRGMINELYDISTLLRNQIISTVVNHNQSETAHENIRSYVRDRETTHINNDEAHPKMNALINDVLEIATSAYNLALGQSKVTVIPTERELYGALMDNGSRVVGDIFLVEKKDSVDFTYLGKCTENEKSIAQLEGRFFDLDAFESGNVCFEGNKVYIIDTVKVRSTSRDIDTTILAKSGWVESIEKHLLSLEEDSLEHFEALEDAVVEKEQKMKFSNDFQESIALSNYTQYDLGHRTSLSLTLPETMDEDFCVILNFYSGEVPTAFDCPSEILFTQDDCLDGRLYPVEKRLYEINIKRVCGVPVGKVSAIDYEVIEL